MTISLFIPCLVDQLYPEMGLSMAAILEHLGYTLTYDPGQTCCGQPAFNAGHREESCRVAQSFIETFRHAEIIVAPSGSCVAMVKNYYSELFAAHHEKPAARDIAKKVYEFSQFIEHFGHTAAITGSAAGRVGFHNSCHSYRELGVTKTPLEMLKNVTGIEILQPQGEPVCCGFGGLFSVKYAGIAATMAKTRIEMFTDLGVDTIVSNDPGCIMHMRQEAVDRELPVSIMHLTEFLFKAMQTAAAGIKGEPADA